MTDDYFPSRSGVGIGCVGAKTAQDDEGQEWFSEIVCQRQALIRHTEEHVQVLNL